MTANPRPVPQLVISKLGRPARMVGVALLALVMLIPLDMVRSVVRDRFETYRGVVADIASSWSGDQRLAGPILVVPYSERFEVRDEFITPEGEKRRTSRWETRERRAVILPDTLSYDGDLSPELRRRGIYEVQIYTAEIEVAGVFRDIGQSVASLCAEDRLEAVHLDRAVVAFGLTDPRGIVEVDGFDLNGGNLQPRPGTTVDGLVERGFHLLVGEVLGDTLDFAMPMVIRGSGGLHFLPLGETTRASLRSTWPHPSFSGEVLPAGRTVTEEGFSAEWTIPLLNRSYPQVWVAGTEVAIGEITAGVRLFEPVALYDLVTRAVKYGLLFIALSFLTLGLIEYATEVRLSLVQFLLIGVALALFFLVLLALAEHIGFAAAYLLAASTVVGLNTLYCAAILGRTTAAVVGAVLSAVYAVLYLILQAEDYALLGGTVLLVVALAATMFFTRRVHEG